MKIEDLIVSAESVKTGKRLIGYVCGCKSCRTAYPDEEYDHNRPIGLLTHPEEDYGNVRVYTDNLELVGGAYGPANNYSRHDKQQVEDGVQQIKEWENEDGEREKESFNRN